MRDTLRRIWLDPLGLDPARASARVTREVAAQLAELARSLEASGHAPQLVAAYLTRCLFSMFAEDVGLLPGAGEGGQGGQGAKGGQADQGGFVTLLKRHRDDPATLQRMLAALWADMDRGGFSVALAQTVLRFNGKLFKGAADDAYSLPLNRAQVDLLLAAARANWREVEPAIFGALLERALDPAERHALGAHYTPRAYVERLVLPTVMEPLRREWADAQAAALLLAHEAAELDGRPRDAKMDAARAELRRFHHRLCTLRVLDPACGSGNFLYVTLEHLKRLEGEVLNQLAALGETQNKLALEGETVTPQQLLGLEVNARAAALAELVLWIGYLQWHIRTRGDRAVAEPVVHDYGNIACRDAVLAWSAQRPLLDAQASPAPAGTAAPTPSTPPPWNPSPIPPPKCRNGPTTNPAPPTGRRPTTSSATRPSSAPPPCVRRWATAMWTPCAACGPTCPRAPTSSCTGGTPPRAKWPRARRGASASSPPTACARPSTAAWCKAPSTQIYISFTPSPTTPGWTAPAAPPCASP
ncbi:hypothetical protein THICB3180124 [Thiomonas sp. CB3]|nr:hypothetical protein THICB3180124 [Thiomonas sp. CB3]